MTDEQVSGAPARTRCLALFGYAELRAMEALAAGAALAPDTTERIALLRFAGQRYGNHRALVAAIASVADTTNESEAAAVMTLMARPVDEFHRHTEAKSWPEVLVSLQAADGLAADFYRAVADGSDDLGLLADLADPSAGEAQQFAAERIDDLVVAEPRLSGRLTLWARRVVGEAMTQGQRLVGDDPELAEVLTGREAGPDLAAASTLFGRLLSSHTTRMAGLKGTP